MREGSPFTEKQLQAIWDRSKADAERVNHMFPEGYLREYQRMVATIRDFSQRTEKEPYSDLDREMWMRYKQRAFRHYGVDSLLGGKEL